MYGHGLFGDYTEVHTTNVRQLGNDHGVLTCATDFTGMMEDDVGTGDPGAAGPLEVPAAFPTGSSRASSTSSTWVGC